MGSDTVLHQTQDSVEYRELLRREEQQGWRMPMQGKRSDAERYISRVESQKRECKIMSKYVQADWIAVNYDDA